MQIIKPTKKEVFEEMRKGDGCCWLGGRGCQCYNKSWNIKGCYESAEKRLTKTIYTEEEIAEHTENNKKAMENLNNLLDELFG